MSDFTDDFDAPALDTEVWIPSYLPQWSSRPESAATYALAGSELRLTIPPEHGLWCSPEHDPLRVSGLQSGVFSGEVGPSAVQRSASSRPSAMRSSPGPARPSAWVHPFRDPAITDEFEAPRVAIDVTEPHVYAADWRPGRVDFSIDGEPITTVYQAPDYPMQMMVAVFDFPDKAASAAQDHVPELAVDWVRGRRIG